MPKLLSVLSGFVAAILLLMAIALWGSGDLISHTIEKSRRIDADFREAAVFIENFRKENTSLPTSEEVREWSEVEHRALIDIAFDSPPEAVEKLGTPPVGGYFITSWRGEWSEYYASWSGKTTLTFDKKAYYMTGKAWLDILLIASAGCLFAFLTVRLWPHRKESITA